MSKRNKVILETAESKFLKEARISAGLSLQKLANLLQVSKQQVHLMETGRANISDDYLRLLRETLSISEGVSKTQSKESNRPKIEATCGIDESVLRQICKAKLERLSETKLEKLNAYLDCLNILLVE